MDFIFFGKIDYSNSYDEGIHPTTKSMSGLHDGIGQVHHRDSRSGKIACSVYISHRFPLTIKQVEV